MKKERRDLHKNGKLKKKKKDLWQVWRAVCLYGFINKENINVAPSFTLCKNY